MYHGRVPCADVRRHSLTSELLKGNPLGDPHERELWVYAPPGFEQGPCKIGLLALAGFTGDGPMLFNTDPLGEGLGARLDRLIRSGACPPVVVAAPDCFTRVGGNQYIDSSATGAYASHLVREVLPFVARTYGVERWAVFGKSSGGYGAMVLSMLNPGVFLACADHSGDANFELCYLLDAPCALDQFRAAGGPRAWLDAYWSRREGRRSTAAQKTLNFLAMAAHYSPRPESETMGIDFPFCLESGRFRPEVWARWQAWDPVRMAEHHQGALRSLRAIYLDCGDKDEFTLHWGARALSAELGRLGVQHVYETFDDGHMNITYRFDRSIPLLAQALARE